MNIADFDYQLPDSLIATHPCKNRSQSKLFIPSYSPVDKTQGEGQDKPQEKQYQIKVFSDLVDELEPNDLLIFNDTKVIPARLFGYKPTGGKVEIFLERLLSEHSALVQMRSSKGVKVGQVIHILSSDDALVAELTCVDKADGFYTISYSGALLPIFEDYGHIPLPPYIDRAAVDEDSSRYQTVYAKHQGAVAAPTAGLHFDDALLDTIKAKGVGNAFVTLHVGAGTFQPVRVEDITEHQMHSERFSVPQVTIDAIIKAKANGGRIIAVGTTTVRALETMMQALQKEDISLETLAQNLTKTNTDYISESQIFIYPGYQFLLIEGLITNFHLPRSTLIMMISAFAGYDRVMQAYKDAVNEKLRFYSYGDAMLLWPESVSK